MRVLAGPFGPLVAEIVGGLGRFHRHDRPRAPCLGPEDRALWRAQRLERDGCLLGLVQRDTVGGIGKGVSSTPSQLY